MRRCPLLKVVRLTHQFGRFTALSDVSLEVAHGALPALIGPNGAGKTTFYNAISGRFPPTSGHVFFDGVEITGRPAHQLARDGLVRSFQVTNVFPHLSVRDNVLVPLVLAAGKGFSIFGSMAGQRRLRERAETILADLGLEDAGDRPVRDLAYGDQRLVEMAIVLARSPRLVLLDEPTAGMTPEETDRMVELIRDLAGRGETHFFITEHDMRVVFSVATRIFVLHQGQLLAEGTPAEIRENPDVRSAYLGGSLDA